MYYYTLIIAQKPRLVYTSGEKSLPGSKKTWCPEAGGSVSHPQTQIPTAEMNEFQQKTSPAEAQYH